MSFVNPYRFGEYDFFNITPTRGFSAYKDGPTGSVGGDITDYDFGGGNSTFDAATGVWSAGNTGLHLMTFSGFPEGGKGGGERQNRMFKDGVYEGFRLNRDFNTGSGTGSSACISFLQNVTSGEDFKVKQESIDRAEDVAFSSVYLPTTEMDGEYQATKTPGSGSAGGVITGLTEEFDPDGAFNATTGVYTAPNAGLHLVQCFGFPDGGTTANNHGLSLLLNGSAEGYVAQTPNPFSTAGVSKLGCALVDLSASDTISWRQDGDTMDTVVMGGMRITGSSNYFSARKAVASGATHDTIAGWTEDFDVGSNFNATSGVFTAPSAGTWWFTWTGEWSSISSGEVEGQMALVINGVNVEGQRALAREFTAASNPAQLGHSFAAPIRLRSGDTVELQQVGKTMNTCYFAGFSVDW